MPALERGIIFDFDGILADTVGAHAAARVEAFDQLGFVVSPEIHEEGHRHGSHPSEIIGWILKTAGYVDKNADVLEDETVQTVVARKEEIYHIRAADGLDSIEGALVVVGWASTMYGKQNLAIATTASRTHEVDPFLVRHNIGRFFNIIVAREDTPKGKMKPEGFVYTEAAQRLGMDPHDLIALEDSPRGLQSALAAEVPVIGVTTTHDYKDLTIADHVVESMFAVPEYITDL